MIKNSSDYIKLYHGTNFKSLRKILENGIIAAAVSKKAFFTADLEIAARYASETPHIKDGIILEVDFWGDDFKSLSYDPLDRNPRWNTEDTTNSLEKEEFQEMELLMQFLQGVLERIFPGEHIDRYLVSDYLVEMIPTPAQNETFFENLDKLSLVSLVQKVAEGEDFSPNIEAFKDLLRKITSVNSFRFFYFKENGALTFREEYYESREQLAFETDTVSENKIQAVWLQISQHPEIPFSWYNKIKKIQRKELPHHRVGIFQRLEKFNKNLISNLKEVSFLWDQLSRNMSPFEILENIRDQGPSLRYELRTWVKILHRFEKNMREFLEQEVLNLPEDMESFYRALISRIFQLYQHLKNILNTATSEIHLTSSVASKMEKACRELNSFFPNVSLLEREILKKKESLEKETTFSSRYTIAGKWGRLDRMYFQHLFDSR